MSKPNKEDRTRKEGGVGGAESTLVALYVFLVAFSVRMVAAIATTLFGVNPESHADAVGFANTAAAMATGLLNGQLLTPGSSITYDLWGAFLAPFWLLPGPSIFYARLGNAVLGALAIYNVYVIARYYHSPRAGVLAALPMIFYPSFVAIHSTVLREAIILFGLTMTARLVLLPSKNRHRAVTYGVSLLLISVAYIHRPDNVIIYAITVGAGILTYAVSAGYLTRRTLLTGVAISPLAIVVSLPYVREGIEFLARTRELRASGRTVYLPDVIPETIPEFLAFSWVGAAYFLYAPFPWMIETIPDLLVSIEGMISLGFTIAALWGVRSLYHRNTPATVALLVGFAVAVVLYGVGTVNYGTGMRHRQMFLWVVFLFGGIGIAEHVRFE